MSFWDYIKYNRAQRAFKRGLQAVNEKRYAEAIDLLNEVIAKRPDHFLYYYLRGVSYHKLRQPDTALEDYNTALRLKPKHGATRYNRGLLYLSAKDFEKAVADFSVAIESKFNAFQARAQAHHHIGNIDQALADIEEAISHEPQNILCWLTRASIFQRTGNFKNAIENLEQVLEIDPMNGAAHNNLAWLLATAEQDEFRNGKNAVEHALAAINGQDTPPPAHVGTLAAAYAEAGQFTEAVRWATRFLESNPPSENIEKAQLRLNLYRQNQPYRMKIGEFETVRDNRFDKK